VHDEIICETDEDEGNLEEFLKLISVCPEWAPDLPIGAEGWTGTRYRKQ
jgi:DNA polymerase